jgi:hypothetical protein
MVNKKSTSCIKYPIDKSEIGVIYGKYELMGFMHPQDFLDIASPIDFDKETPHSMNQLTSTEWQKKQIQDKNPLSVTMLSVGSKGKIGEISGHEGRHRAKASLELGIDELPVVLRVYNHIPFKNQYGFIDYDKINALVSSKKSVEKMIQDIGEAQKNADIPSFCTKSNDTIICNIQPEISDKDYILGVKKPAKKIAIQITNFKPLC